VTGPLAVDVLGQLQIDLVADFAEMQRQEPISVVVPQLTTTMFIDTDSAKGAREALKSLFETRRAGI
jgi:hypothetical protein